jgi:hypothetical protein
MKRLILFCSMSLLMLHAGAQPSGKTHTITASLSKDGIISGDTAFFDYYGTARNVTYFFYRHLRFLNQAGAWDKYETGSCNLYFMIDTAGNVTKAWCDSVTNTVVEKEVLRVAGKLAPLKPTKIKGNPVVTTVMAKVLMVDEVEYESNKNLKADILLIAYPPQRKSTAGKQLPGVTSLVKK